MQESEAIACLQRGDIRGLDSLVVAYQLPAIRAAYLIVQDRALAEDIVQAAFIRVYERSGQFDPTRPFGPWFLRGVVNAALTAAIRARRCVPPDAEAADGGPALGEPYTAGDDLLAAAETREAIRQAVAALPPAQRAAVVSRYYLDLSEDEMAARLGCPPGTVKWRLHAARRRLRTLLPAWLQPGGGAAGDVHVRPAPARPREEESTR